MKVVLVLLAFILMFPYSVMYADLRINEIYPIPLNADDEWIELYNDSDSAVSLTDYQVVDEKNNPLTIMSSEIMAHAYAKATSRNVLNNTGDTVTLLFKNNPIHSVIYPEGMTAGMTYVFCSSRENSWLTSMNPSPLAENLTQCTASSSAQLTTSPSPDVTAIPTELLARIYINEYMPYPETGSQEWVELYNDNDIELQLTEYYIDDEEQSGSSPYAFSAQLPPHGYRVIALSSSLLNNTSDAVRLLTPQKNMIAGSSYSSAPKGKTWGSSSDRSRLCIQEPSPGDSNNTCDEPTPSVTTASPLPTHTLIPSVAKHLSLTTVPTSIKRPVKSNILGAMITHGPATTKSESVALPTRGISPSLRQKEPDPQKLRILIIVSTGIIVALVVSIVIRIRHEMLQQE
jgi:hypothetical protein